ISPPLSLSSRPNGNKRAPRYFLPIESDSLRKHQSGLSRLRGIQLLPAAQSLCGTMARRLGHVRPARAIYGRRDGDLGRHQHLCSVSRLLRSGDLLPREETRHRFFPPMFFRFLPLSRVCLACSTGGGSSPAFHEGPFPKTHRVLFLSAR